MSEQQPNDAAKTTQPGEVPWWQNDPWYGGHLYAENRNKNCELLLQYVGKYVAWFPDGSGIRDADENELVLMERIKASGDKLIWFPIEYVPDMAQI